jgi:putative molybdopterin biosynthesis protein
MEPSYTTEEIANLLKISKLTVYDLIKKGELPAYRVGRQMRIDAKDLEAYKERAKQGVQGEPEPELFQRKSHHPSPQPRGDGRQVILTGQDLSLDLLCRHLEKREPGIRLLRTNKGSMESLIGLFRGEVDVASTHLFDGETKTYNTPYLSKLLSGYRYIVFNLVSRKAGLYVQKGNPKNLQGWADLKNKDLTLINREKGSGARVLLDEQLRLHGISCEKLTGYDHEETGHLGVAAVIANGDADVGVGSERAAQLVGIDFIPLIEERYDLVLLKKEENDDLIQHVKDLLNSTAFKNELQYIGGYNLSKTGEIIFEN